MTEKEARSLALEIILQQGWFAYPEQEPFEIHGRRRWWVRVRHASMRYGATVPLLSRAEWRYIRARWSLHQVAGAMENQTGGQDANAS